MIGCKGNNHWTSRRRTTVHSFHWSTVYSFKNPDHHPEENKQQPLGHLMMIEYKRNIHYDSR